MQSARTRHGGGWLVAVVGVLAGLGGMPGVVVAQTPSYEPGSPAGTEYAIPLDEARQTGSTPGAARGQRGSSAPRKSGAASGDDDAFALFGEGVARAKKPSAAAGNSRKPAKATKAARPAPAQSEQVRATGSSISGTVVALGTGGLVFALGAALTGAIVMSRRLPRSR